MLGIDSVLHCPILQSFQDVFNTTRQILMGECEVKLGNSKIVTSCFVTVGEERSNDYLQEVLESEFW